MRSDAVNATENTPAFLKRRFLKKQQEKPPKKTYFGIFGSNWVNNQSPKCPFSPVQSDSEGQLQHSLRSSRGEKHITRAIREMHPKWG